MHDALCVLVNTIKNKRTTYGGGHAEMVMAKACDDLAKTLVGKKGLAVEAFAFALRALPTILCENGGYDA
jgi:T-complex protein 1 subunit beta